MGLVNLLTPAEGDVGWREYWFNHYQDHLEIVQAIQASRGVKLTVYLIDPWSDFDKDGILERHQQYHNDMDSVLGIAGNDLSTVDFKKAHELKAWLFLNFQEHLQARTALSI